MRFKLYVAGLHYLVPLPELQVEMSPEPLEAVALLPVPLPQPRVLTLRLPPHHGQCVNVEAVHVVEELQAVDAVGRDWWQVHAATHEQQWLHCGKPMNTSTSMGM